MLNFAEQTGICAVIVAWSFLLLIDADPGYVKTSVESCCADMFLPAGYDT
jgi:hypothetical protein